MVTILGIIGPFEIILILLIAIPVFLILPLIALIDIIRSNFKDKNDKLIWVLILLFLGIIGAILYFIVGKKQKLEPPIN